MARTQEAKPMGVAVTQVLCRARKRPAARRGLAGIVAVATSAATMAAPALAAAPTLKQYLVRGNEETGFHVSGRIHETSKISAYLQGVPKNQKKKDAAKLRAGGFKASVFEQLDGPDHANGGSAVTEMGSPRAARELQRFQVNQIRNQGSGTYKRLTVPGVPGAVGYDFTCNAGNGCPSSDTNIYWVQGRCLIFVGDIRSSSTPLSGPVLEAVRAVHKRTHGTCP
jgi:hypothetical protein